MGTSNKFCEHQTNPHNLGVVVEYRDRLYSELKRRTEQTETEKTRSVPVSLKSCSFIWLVNEVSVSASALYVESLYPRLIIQRIHPCSLQVYIGFINTVRFSSVPVLCVVQ